jgi:predicted amidohydrolase
MIIALASPSVASALDEGLEKIERLLSEASAQGAEIVCFPESE